MIFYQNSRRILEENSCMLFTGDILPGDILLAILLTGDIIDWRYFAWRYFAGDLSSVHHMYVI